jgi:hypothetical protein
LHFSFYRRTGGACFGIQQCSGLPVKIENLRITGGAGFGIKPTSRRFHADHVFASALIASSCRWSHSVIVSLSVYALDQAA